MAELVMVSCKGCGREIESRYGRKKWCSERCRKRQYAGRCETCGAPTSGSDGRRRAPRRCGRCGHVAGAERMRQVWDARQAEKRQRVISLVAAGLSDRAIAVEVGMTKGAVGVFLSRLRRYGYKVPPRRYGRRPIERT